MNLHFTLLRRGCFFAWFEERGVGRMLAHSITLKPLTIVAVTKISQNNLLIISNI